MLLLIQTIVLAVTGAIVYYYASETKKIRTATERQNTLIAQQLILMTEKQSFELEKEKGLIEPIFRYRGASHGSDQSASDFVNEGGLVKNISIETIDNFSAKIKPNDVIRSGEKGRINFSSYPDPHPDKLRFKIEYENQMGKRGEQHFYIIPGEGRFSPEEKEVG